MNEIKNCPSDTFFQNFELFAITDSNELSFSNLYFLNWVDQYWLILIPANFIGDRNKLLKGQNVGFSK